MLHFHICPTEIAAFIQLYEVMAMYAFHIKHIVFSFFTQMYHKHCKVCNK